MRRVWLSLLAVLLALGLVFALVLDRQGRAASEALRTDVNAMQARTLELDAATFKGSVFECVAPEADVAPELSQGLRSLDPTVRAIAQGHAPFSTLPEAQRVEFESHLAWMDRVLACGEQRFVVPTDGIGPYADIRHGRRQSMPRLMDALSSLAPLKWRRTETLQSDQVLRECGELWVLAVGWQRLEGLESMLPTLVTMGSTMGLCLEAAKQASPEAKSAFLQRVKDLKSLAPTFSEVMALERTQNALRLFGAWVPLDVNAQLPMEAQRWTQTQRETKWARGVPATLALRLYWRRFEPGMRAVGEANSASEASASQAQLVAPMLRRFMAADPVDLRYDMYIKYVENLATQLRLLEEAAAQ
jgi:hypothetical protein